MDTNSIRTRLNGLGWFTKEIPMRRMDPKTEERTVMMYKVIAIKGDKSFEVTGPSLDEAMNTLGVQMGIIPR